MEKILIVDDNGELRKIIKVTLGYGKYKLLEASDGEMAVQVAEAELPSIIILDIMMPGVDGYEVCRRLKSNPRLKSSYVIMLTALGQKQDRETGMDAGADFYMTKPFSPNELILVIEGVRTGKKSAESVSENTQGIQQRVSDQH